jgi:hypothetical protein
VAVCSTFQLVAKSSLSSSRPVCACVRKFGWLPLSLSSETAKNTVPKRSLAPPTTGFASSRPPWQAATVRNRTCDLSSDDS